MRKHCMAMVIVVISMFGVLAGEKTVMSVTASLRDGSTVKGEFNTSEIKGGTLFDKELVLSPSLVKSIGFTGTNGESKVELVNGDRFAMKIANDSFELRSMLGDLKIPRANFRTISLSARSASAAKGGSSEGLIFHCTFDGEKSITSPSVGPAGRYMTGSFVDGKVGMALMTTPFTKHAVFELPVGFIRDSGCIEFWAKILKQAPSVGAGGDPRLLAITCADSHKLACNIDVVSNDGAGNSGFALRTWFGCKSSISGMPYLRYADLFSAGDWRDWHHYSVVWDKNGISDLLHAPKAALLVDGKMITSVGFQSGPTQLNRMPSETSYVLGITYDPDVDAEHNTKSPFLIDEFKIWDYAKTDFQ